MKMMKIMENTAGIVIEKFSYPTNMSLLVLFVVITSINESTNSLKYKEKNEFY